jgi:AP-1-like factor
MNRRPSSPKLSSPSSSSNASTPENTTGDIPQSTLFARPNPSVTGLNSTSSISSGSSPRSEATTSRFQSSPGAFGLGSTLPDSSNASGLDVTFFGADLNLLNTGKTNNVNGITTIAANPMYMSFGDPILDPMAWASFGPGDYTTASPTIPNPSSDLELFGVSPYGNNGAISVANGGISGLGLTGSYSNIDDLFGAAVTTGSGVTPSFLDLSGNQSGTHSTASSSTGGATFTASSPSAVGTNSDVNSSAAGNKDDEHGTCPRTIEDVHRLQKTMLPSTFGPPVTVKGSSAGSAKSPLSPGSLPQRENNEKDHASAHARMAALCADLPRTTKKPNQIEIGRAWEKIRQHQGFEECDIDELCHELSAKARCDGSRPVLEEASFNNIVQSLATVHKKRAATA